LTLKNRLFDRREGENMAGRNRRGPVGMGPMKGRRCGYSSSYI